MVCVVTIRLELIKNLNIPRIPPSVPVSYFTGIAGSVDVAEMSRVFPRNNWQRCYEESLQNLREELFKRAQRRNSKKDWTSCSSKLSLFQELPAPIPSEGLALTDQPSMAVSELAQKLPRRQTSTTLEEDDTASHWSNSNVSVTLVDSTLDQLLHSMAMMSDVEELKPQETNMDLKAVAHKYVTQSSKQRPGKETPNSVAEETSAKNAGEEEILLSDLQATRDLMDALKRKIVDVQRIVDYR